MIAIRMGKGAVQVHCWTYSLIFEPHPHSAHIHRAHSILSHARVLLMDWLRSPYRQWRRHFLSRAFYWWYRRKFNAFETNHPLHFPWAPVKSIHRMRCVQDSVLPWGCEGEASPHLSSSPPSSHFFLLTSLPFLLAPYTFSLLLTSFSLPLSPTFTPSFRLKKEEKPFWDWKRLILKTHIILLHFQ